MKHYHQYRSLIGASFLLTALLAVALMLPSCSGNTVTTTSAAPSFPDKASLNSKTIHARQTTNFANTDRKMITAEDLWVNPVTGQFRVVETTNGTVTQVSACDGQMFRAYDTESHRAVSLSKVVITKIEPESLTRWQGSIKDSVASTAALVKTADAGAQAFTYNGRAATKYHIPVKAGSGTGLPEDLIVDDATGLPLEATFWGVDGQLSYTGKYEYELSSPKEGYGLQFPSGYYVETDADYTVQMITSLDQLVAQSGHAVYALGEEFNQLRISRSSYRNGIVSINYSDSPDEQKVAPQKYISLTEEVPSKMDAGTLKNIQDSQMKTGSVTTKWGAGTIYRAKVGGYTELEITIDGMQIRIMPMQLDTSPDSLVKIANSLEKVGG